MKLPIQTTEIDIDENWIPELDKQYIIEYHWNRGLSVDHTNTWWLIGTFHETNFGYSFHWPWSASSLQLAVKGKSSIKSPDDWKNFKRVYLFEPHIEPDFISKEDTEI